MSEGLYQWPSAKEWKRWTREEKLMRAMALVEQADRQRNPMFQGDLTQAQRLARDLLQLAEAEKDE